MNRPRLPAAFRIHAKVASAIAIGAMALVLPLRGQEDVAESPSAKAEIDTTPIIEAPITESDRLHWAFAPVVRAPLPAVKDATWLRSPVDAFILAKLESAGLTSAGEASRASLLRRLSFDLVGLPPAPEELAQFEADTSPDAYERQLDRLLASPAYGERWGQHWLDLARFAETDGFEHDKVRPDAWQYRDWVVAALNVDLPYDEFIRLQVAGDEIADSPVATMFCLAGPDMPDINDQAERRHIRLNEVTSTVGSVFLGLQIGCAQCHDHKYDPLSQADFYRLRAVFESAVPPLKRDVPYNTLKSQKEIAPARLWVRGDHRRPGPELSPAFPRIASTPARSVTAGDKQNEDAKLSADSVGMRSQLAEWLTSAENPLTSRVMANRVWQQHFGLGLCETPSDFGVMSGTVTHPKLLDWLAVELRETGWELKRLHRTIVTSATYRQAGRNSEFRMQNAETEGASTLYHYFPGKRLEGEAIRDAMLQSAGLLVHERGGPGVMPPLPDELVGTLLKGQWKESKREADHYRRSIYVFARRNLRYPIFEAFDRPDANASCPIRSRSTTAPQSLVMLNSQFSLLTARHLAGRIVAVAAEPPQQIEQLYLLALARKPTVAEQTALQQFLSSQTERLRSEGRLAEQLALPMPLVKPVGKASDPYADAALVDACLALMNANEFVYVD